MRRSSPGTENNRPVMAELKTKLPGVAEMRCVCRGIHSAALAPRSSTCTRTASASGRSRPLCTGGSRWPRVPIWHVDGTGPTWAGPKRGVGPGPPDGQCPLPSTSMTSAVRRASPAARTPVGRNTIDGPQRPVSAGTPSMPCSPANTAMRPAASTESKFQRADRSRCLVNTAASRRWRATSSGGWAPRIL
jgi:hypothetical protein